MVTRERFPLEPCCYQHSRHVSPHTEARGEQDLERDQHGHQISGFFKNSLGFGHDVLFKKTCSVRVPRVRVPSSI